MCATIYAATEGNDNNLNDFIGFDFICYFPSFTFDIRPTYLHVIISISLQGSGLFYYNRTQNTYTTNKILYVKAYALRFDFKFFGLKVF